VITVDFALDQRTQELREQLWAFMREYVFPAEEMLEAQVAEAGDPYHFEPAIKDDLKAEARSRGLWNLFLPDPLLGGGLSNLQYAPLAEITGWSPSLAPEALNCSAPDSGNMELLTLFGTPRPSP
jgi:acyl-CoA dehydrogenase